MPRSLAGLGDDIHVLGLPVLQAEGWGLPLACKTRLLRAARVYLTQGAFKVVLQTSGIPQIRQLILYYY